MKLRKGLALAAGLLLAGAASAGGEAEIGIPECDRFISSYEACVMNKVPAAHRVAFAQQVTQLRTTWRSLAQDPQARADLERICRTHSAQMRRGLEPFGCNF